MIERDQGDEGGVSGTGVPPVRSYQGAKPLRQTGGPSRRVARAQPGADEGIARHSRHRLCRGAASRPPFDRVP